MLRVIEIVRKSLERSMNIKILIMQFFGCYIVTLAI